MSDEQLYEVLIRDEGQILKYLMKYKIIPYWGEPENQEKLQKVFRENHYNKGDYEILQIEESNFVDIIIAKDEK